MIGLWAKQKAALYAAWNRFVAVEAPDEEDARLGRLFCGMMVVTFGLLLGLTVLFGVATARGMFSPTYIGWIETAFPISFMLLVAFSFWRVKKGYIRSTASFFIWANFIGVALAVFSFDGVHSPGWLLFFWPIAMAGMFLHPTMGIRMSVGVIIYYALMAWGMSTGTYTPPVLVSVDLFYYLFGGFVLLTLFGVAGLLNYVSLRSLQDVLVQTRTVSRELRQTQRTLEKRVVERTAELEKRAGQLRIIAELNRAIASITEIEPLLDTAVQLIAQRLGYDHVGIFLIDPHNEWAVLRAASSEGGQRMLARGHRLRVGQQGIVGYVAQTGVPRLAFSVGEDAVWFNNPDLPNTQSEISLPLFSRGQTVIGVLDIQTNTPAAFTEEDVEVLRILADGIAVAVVNTRSLMETTATLARLERYQEQDALRAWRQALARRQMRVGYGFDSGFVYPVDVTFTTELADSQLTAVTTRVTESGRHLLLAPIRIQNRNVGVLSFEKSVPWADDQIQLAQFVVEQLALALDNARLLEETRLRANQERARSDIVGRIRAMTSTDAILRNAARELGLALQVERSRIQLLPPGEGRTDRAETSVKPQDAQAG
ncbi:MAG TPA: GAF domain-containing protein [Anaerolineae bacterium]|nr:GAF domain-containing protein [Anaerolineae bacterium]HQK13005.1 GAF domain-containing protein [Anaerolineae bacterium]